MEHIMLPAVKTLVNRSLMVIIKRSSTVVKTHSSQLLTESSTASRQSQDPIIRFKRPTLSSYDQAEVKQMSCCD